MIIKNEGVIGLIESDTLLLFMRDLKNSQYSIADQIKMQIFKKPKDKPIDFQKALSKKQDSYESNGMWNILDIDESLETFCLMLYSCAMLQLKDIQDSSKAALNIHLMYDILQLIIYKVDPWFIEQIILKFHDQKLLKERLGATGETLYDLTEEFVISNWNMFSDQFRHLYRHTLYED